ncbi:MAG: sulfatase-like hydrolase/transferase, partial [Pseudomonadota bacterium]
MTRPNILFIQVDQLAAQFLRCYGDPVCHAPNLGKLADEGTVFETAYCNFPLCAPSRASMATGKLCSEIGAYDNAAELPASMPTYAHYLRASGYQTALSGKMHFIGPDQHHGFETRLTPDLYPADFSWVPNWGDEGDRDTNDARAVTVAGLCERSVQMDFDDLVTFHAIQHLYDLARSDDTRPFFLQVSYTHPPCGWV